MFDSYFAIFLSTTLWVLHYFTVRSLIKDKSAEFCNRIITLAHGSTIALLGVNQCFTGDVSPIYTPLEPSTNLQKFIIVLSLGYFLFDLAWCLFYQTETKLMISHHLCSVFALWRMLSKENSGGQVTCCMGALEITNPFLQARWFVRSFGYHNTPLFNSVEMVYVMLFLFIRILVGTFYVFVLITHGNTWEFIIISASIYVISWMFVFNILRFMQSKYRELLARWVPDAADRSEITSHNLPPHS